MMRGVSGILILLLPLCLEAQFSSHNGAAKYAPAKGSKLLIMGQDLGAVGGLGGYSDGYIDHLNHHPAGVTTYTGFPGLTGLSDLANWGAGDVHAQAYVEDASFDNSFIVIGLYLVDQLGSIIKGESDTQLDKLGGWIKARERPVFLRIAYEFDGSWNHYDPAQYKEAWIYIVHYFDGLGVMNVSYVWQSHGGNTPNIDRWYPGDRYVNWMGFSHFNEPNPGANMMAFAEEHDKPVMIAEATPKVDLKVGDGTAHWAGWYAPLFDKIYTNDRIKALAYINVDWDSQDMWQGQGWGDSRVQVNEAVKANWLEEIGKDSWILASDSLFDMLDYEMWQDSLVSFIRPEMKKAGELRVFGDANRLVVHELNHAPMDGITIWDISGRLLYRSHARNSEYEIESSLIAGTPLLVLQVQTGDRLLRTKVKR